MNEALENLLAGELLRLEGQQLLRVRRAVRVVDATHVEIDGRCFVNFASNNYLGLTHHARVIAAARKALSHGFGSGAAPLVTGHTDLHAAAEQTVAAWKGTEDAVLLPSGFQANHAAVGALAAIAHHSAGRPIRFLLDKLAHASLIDAVRSTGAPFRIFPHNGVPKLRRLLEKADPAEMQAVVTESIFSMDGDAADLGAIAALKRDHPFVLLLDEAHASGVYGSGGAGYAAELGLRDSVDISVVTFSKALGATGGAVCASRRFCQAVVNFGRAYLFSTALPPAIAAAVVAGIGVLQQEPARQARLRELSRRVRSEFCGAGITIPAGDSPIIPIILGSEQAALAASASLQERGLLVIPIRPPTVPRGTSRLRITLSSEHTDAEVHQLIEALKDIHE